MRRPERVNSCRTDQTWLASGGNPGPRYLAVDNRRVAQPHVSVGQDRVGRWAREEVDRIVSAKNWSCALNHEETVQLVLRSEDKYGGFDEKKSQNTGKANNTKLGQRKMRPTDR